MRKIKKKTTAIMTIVAVVALVLLAIALIVVDNKVKDYNGAEKNSLNATNNLTKKLPASPPPAVFVKPLQLANSGFEKFKTVDGKKVAANTTINGTWQYANTGCFEGERCIHAKLNSTEYLKIDYDPVPITPGQTYSWTLHFNCIECSNTSTYFSIIWVRLNNESEKSQYYEIPRIIQTIKQFSGYQTAFLQVTAPNESSWAIPIIRMNTDGIDVKTDTEIYVDQ